MSEGNLEIVIMSIYTKSGDNGETSLFDGSRVLKSDVRVELLGRIDELNSYLGLLISCLNYETPILSKIQSLLFNLGAEIANPKVKKGDFYDCSNFVVTLEEEIDKMTAELPPLKAFILPGGSQASSHSHITRAICRGVERLYWQFDGEKNASAGKFLNRLSDYFFTLARFLNFKAGVADVEWRN